jgi:hypothetical protein
MSSRTTRRWCVGSLVAIGISICFTGYCNAGPLLSSTMTYQEVGGPDDTLSKVAVGDSFSIVNNSDAGVQITQVLLTLAPGVVFDTVDDASPATSGTGPSFAFSSTTIDPLLVSGAPIADGSSSVLLTFTGFDPGKTFDFTVDVDQTTGVNANVRRQVLGNEFAGGTIAVTFADSFVGSPLTLTGTFTGAGQTASATVTTVIPEPSTFALGLFGIVAIGLAMRRRGRTTG